MRTTSKQIPRLLRTTLTVALLVATLGLSAASMWGDDDGEWDGNDNWNDNWNRTVTPRMDETWVVENLYDGQTAVSRHPTIRLTVGIRDFDGAQVTALGQVDLRNADTHEPVTLNAAIYQTTSILTVDGILDPDTEYVLDLSGMGLYLTSIRELPGDIRFSTASAPRVIGLWRNEDTLLVEFSQPMDAATLFPGQTSVDLIWEENGVLHSLAADTNLAGFVWETWDQLFLLAPVDFADPLGPIWIKVAAEVSSRSGDPLDGDGDNEPGSTSDDYIELFDLDALPECYARDDIPRPCMRLEDIPDLWW